MYFTKKINHDLFLKQKYGLEFILVGGFLVLMINSLMALAYGLGSIELYRFSHYFRSSRVQIDMLVVITTSLDKMKGKK